MMGPTGATGPTGPAGPAEPVSAAYAENGCAQKLMPGDELLFGDVRTIGAALYFDDERRYLIARECGTYFFAWHVSGLRCDEGDAMLLHLEREDGCAVYARSGAKNLHMQHGTVIHGTTVVTLEAGERIALRNRSEGALLLDPVAVCGGEGYTFSFTAHKL